jgi:hypothetical protein
MVAAAGSHLPTLIPRLRIFSTLKMEAKCSSETSVHTRSTRRHIPEDSILLKSILINTLFSRRIYTSSSMCICCWVYKGHHTDFMSSGHSEIAITHKQTWQRSHSAAVLSWLSIPCPQILVCSILYPTIYYRALNIGTGYGLGERGVGVRVPIGSRILSSPRRRDQLWGPPSLLCNGYRG